MTDGDYENKMDFPMENLAVALFGVNPTNEACKGFPDHEIVEIAARKIVMLKKLLAATGMHENLIQNIMEDV